MASISKYKTAKGVRYRASIIIKKKGEIIHRESQSFSKRAIAKEWADEREQELRGGGLEKKRFQAVTVGDVVQRYLDRFEPEEGFGRSKKFDIQKLITYPLAKKPVLDIKVKDLVSHAEWRKEGGTGPATINNDFVWLSTIFTTISASEDIPIDLNLVPRAKTLLRKNKMIRGSAQRERRPTREELWKLSRYFWKRQYRSTSTYPMLDIMWFQIYSARRDSETCRILWSDNNDKRLTGMVRDAKHPFAKKGNHKRFKYTRAAWKVAQRQPRVDDRIFPYDPKTVSAYFTRACKILEIKDLHLHDLRHEGTSRLFEQGYTIEQVALHTLHEDWKTLQRYTHLRPEDID